LTSVSRWAVGAIVLAAVAFVLLILFPGADLAVSGWFYEPGVGFPLARLPLFLVLMKALSYAAIGVTVAALLLGIAAAIRRRTWLGVTPPIAAFLTLSLVIGPGLVVNTLFKDQWGRARPHQIAEFGGAAHFTPAAILSDQCNKNCSFPSGHAALAFWLVAFALVTPPRWRPLAMTGALTVGFLIGAMRIAQGGHFLSDVIAAALIVIVINWILKMLILGRSTR
jgi:lipid A 4'-phosphatase